MVPEALAGPGTSNAASPQSSTGSSDEEVITMRNTDDEIERAARRFDELADELDRAAAEVDDT
jgi:HAMP domain-containing protein